jgi:Undecaprenyl-phosphate glucose phosphotransferase
MSFVRPSRSTDPLRVSHRELLGNKYWTVRYSAIGTVVLLADCLVILFVSIFSGATYHLVVFGHAGIMSHFVATAAIVASIFVPVVRSWGGYSGAKLLELHWQIKTVVFGWLGTFSFLFAIIFALQIGSHFSRGAVLGFGFAGAVCTIASRFWWRNFVHYALTTGNLKGYNAIVIWDTAGLGRPATFNDLIQHGLRVYHEYVYSEAPDALALSAEVIALARRADIEEILIVTETNRLPVLEPIFKKLRALPIPVRVLADAATAQLLTSPIQRFGRAVTVECQRAPLSIPERTAKRMLDVVIAVSGLILLLPLFLVVAIAIKLESPGPALFHQKRWGFNGRAFTILKFRTMSVMEDGPLVQQASPKDDRVTRMGRWLRRTSIDELPQLVNVLQGEMSIVGPRPHAAAHDNYYQNIIEKYAFRHNVKPGITGWAQVNGCRGATPMLEDMQKRIELDLWYINNWSFWLDAVIILRSIVIVLRGKNAY